MSSPSIGLLSDCMHNLTLHQDERGNPNIKINPAFGSKVDEKQSAKERAEAYTCGRKPYPKAIFSILRKYIGKRAHVLDVGCGNGRSTLPIKAFWTKDVVGFDNDRQMLNELERVSLLAGAKIETARGSVTDLGVSCFRRRRFDAVCAFSAFSLFKDDERAVSAIISVLKPNGVFIDAGDEGIKNDPLGKLMKEIVKIALDRDLIAPPKAVAKPADATKETEESALAKHNFTPLQTYKFEESELYNFEETFAHFKSREIFRKQKFTALELHKIGLVLADYFKKELKGEMKQVTTNYYCTVYGRIHEPHLMPLPSSVPRSKL